MDDFTGYLLTDGYVVYDEIGQLKGVVHLACWAHARREFERALDNDRERAETALGWIQGLYAVERKAREDGLSPDERKDLRLSQSMPIINPLGAWIHAQAKQVLPKSQIGKAMVYSLLGTCKLHRVNPTQLLTHVLANILQTKYNDVRALYPQNFNQP